MIFADKLIQLRKKNGWSQEDLAEQMDVSRQSVSKWEGAQSIPDIEKIIRLSKLFGVSTDYLLKDEIEENERTVPDEDKEEKSSVRRVTLEEAHNFLSAKAASAGPIALGVFLCIISPVCLLILGAMSERPEYGLSENAAGGIGMIVMLLLAAAAVTIFILSGKKTAEFEFLENEIFETEYGVSGMVKERKEKFKDTHTKSNIIGSCLCILSLMPLFAGAVIDGENDLFLTIMLSLTFLLAGIGVMFFISGGIVWVSFEKLLQEGEYSKRRKESKAVTSPLSTAFWTVTTAIYLAYSFITNDWGRSWIIWPVAGVLYPAVAALCSMVSNKK